MSAAGAPGRWSLATAAAVLVLAPLGLPRPGPRPSLEADEPGYYLLALSLWHDRDARCDEDRDVPRLFHEFSGRAETLWVISVDGWRTSHFGVPIAYSLLTAPAAGLLGANGMLAVNGALFAAMVWMGASYLRRFQSATAAWFFAVAFFVVSAVPPYLYWLHPEVFYMACVTAALWLVAGPASFSRPQGRPFAEPASPRQWLRLAGSGAVFAVVAYAKPPIALLGLPLLLISYRRRRSPGVAAWVLGFFLAVAAVAAAGSLVLGTALLTAAGRGNGDRGGAPERERRELAGRGRDAGDGRLPLAGRARRDRGLGGNPHRPRKVRRAGRDGAVAARGAGARAPGPLHPGDRPRPRAGRLVLPASSRVEPSSRYRRRAGTDSLTIPLRGDLRCATAVGGW